MTTFYNALFSALRLDFVILTLCFVCGLVTAAASTSDRGKGVNFHFQVEDREYFAAETNSSLHFDRLLYDNDGFPGHDKPRKFLSVI